MATSGNTSIPSSWISDVLYTRTPDGQTFLALVLAPRGSQGVPSALLYSGVPSYLPGLLQAGLGGRSIGRAYHRLLRGKGYPEQTVVGEKEVGELKNMISRSKNGGWRK